MDVERQVRALEAAAHERLAADVVDYVAGGSGQEVTLNEATAAWRRYRFLPSVLRDVSSVDISVELFGARLPAPVGVAPFGYQQLLHPEGEVACAAGAGAHLFVLSTRSDREIEDVAAVAVSWWYQVYLTVDRQASDTLVDRAVRSGATALVLTGDTPYVAAKARRGRLTSLDPAHEQDPSITAADVTRLAERTGLPVLVKGVLRADDTRRVLDAGAAGVIVSNHGGRQLDRAVASAQALPSVVAAARGAPVLVDGGIRSGHDVLTALALGARAVLVGRPMAWALATGGRDGVADLLAGYSAELGHVLGLAGHRSSAGVDHSLIATNAAATDVSAPDESPPG